MKYERVLTVVKDAMFVGVSFGGIIYQQVTGDVSVPLLGVYLALLLPAAVPAVLSLRAGGERATTPPSSSPVPERPQSPLESQSGP